MANVQQISEITPSFAFTEFDFYKDYEEWFKKVKLVAFWRNFYKGLFVDSINVMFAVSAFNLKRVMRVLLALIQRWISWVFGRLEDIVGCLAYLMCARA